jgi:hypothetical protein
MMNNMLAAPCNVSAQSGITLVEVLGAMAVGAIVTVGLFEIINDSLDDTKAQQVASYQSKIADAAGKYIRVEHSNILQNYAIPLVRSVQDLRAAGYLDASFAATNPYGQTPCLLIKPNNATKEVLAILATEGGNPIPAKQLAYVASLSQTGGSISTVGGAVTASGAFGNWNIALSDFGGVKCSASAAGVDHLATMVSWGGGGMGGGLAAGTSDFLYRTKVGGNPDANKMMTDLKMSTDSNIDMGGNNLQSAKLISGTGVAATDIWAQNRLTANVVDTKTLMLGEAQPAGCNLSQKGTYARDNDKGTLFWCNGTAWELAGKSQFDENYLSRIAVSGKPDANKMATNLDMDKNDILNLKNIAASGNVDAGGNVAASGYVLAGNVAAQDETCTTRGAIARSKFVVLHDVLYICKTDPNDISNLSWQQIGAGSVVKHDNPMNPLSPALKSKPYTPYTYRTQSGFDVPTSWNTCYRDNTTPGAKGGCVALCEGPGEEAVFGTTFCYDNAFNTSEPVSVVVSAGDTRGGWRGSCHGTIENNDDRKVFVNVLCARK